jgi:hypothetical protein
MPPPHQGLGGDDRPGASIDDGLVVQLELLPLNRAAERVLEREPLQRARVHRP